jgi:hypothetical protein
LAARGALPDQINEESELPIAVVRELIEGGCLQAIDASSFDGDAYLNARITLKGREYLRKLQRSAAAPEHDLIVMLEKMRDIMVAVSTGGPRIDSVNAQYRELYAAADSELRKRGISNSIPFPDLWDWYGRWRSGDLPSYQSRRNFLSEIFSSLFEAVRDYGTGKIPTAPALTGWPKVDRTVGEIRRRLAEAETEEQFQAVGLLCREATISLAQAVYDAEKHPSLDGKQPSETDAKRMLEAYLSKEFVGASNEVARRQARASYDLAVELQHHRTATFRQAALCVEATSSLINVIAIVSGKRDPAQN